jgi:ATP-binding cassette, subfamily B, bacterial MsbA
LRLDHDLRLHWIAMRNFLRATRLGTYYWPSLILAMVCSLGVAAIWGGNIGALSPVMEITLTGRSMQQWFGDAITKGNQEIAKIDEQLRVLQAIPPAQRSSEQLRQIDSLTVSRESEERVVLSAEKSKPWIDRYCPSDPFKTVSLILGLLIVTTIIKSSLIVANEWLVARVTNNIVRDVRRQIFDRALTLDRATFATQGTSSFAAQIVYTSEALARGLANLLGGAIREPLKILSCLTIAAFISWRLLLLSLIVAPLAGFFIVWIGKRLRRVSNRILGQSVGLHECLIESLDNLQTVQAYTMEGEERSRFATVTQVLRDANQRIVLYNSLAKPTIEVFGLAMICTTMLAGSYLILQRSTTIFGIPIADTPMSASSMLIFFGLLIGASDPLRKMGTILQFINAGMIAADNLYPLLDMPSRIQEPINPRSLPKPHSALTLHHVSFGYRADRELLKDVSLTIPFGSTVCIVGANGAGKSTMAQLVCRFYDPVHGSLRLDDVDIRDMALHDLRGRMALVTQNTELFNRSVMENIRYGQPEATDDEVRQAARQAHAEEFILQALPKGYESLVGPSGQFLSGGQRQRIALARALLRKPEILILDEATSQIDMHSEKLIRQSLAELRGSRTMIIITHREALLELADAVYELKAHSLQLQPRLAAA